MKDYRPALALLAATAGLTATGLFIAPAAHASGPDAPTFVATGDIACDPSAPDFNGGKGTSAGCRQAAVADAVRAAKPDVFAPLGDIQYFDATLNKFMASYDKAFGDLKPISKPIPGNHEYKTAGGAGYYSYFGAAAHPESKGTYSYDLGSWHVLAINSTACAPSVPCGPGSAMAKWIAADVAAHPAPCVMAMWHHPLWSAGAHGDYAPMAPVWNQLNSYGVDMVLTGHDHLYQRFKPAGAAVVGADGKLAAPLPTADGMTQFVIGTGGEDNYRAWQLGNPALANSLAAYGTNPNPGVFGAVKFKLRDTGYDFSFLPAAGTTYSDSGSAGCRTKTPPVGVPTIPTDVAVTRAGDGTAGVSWNAPQAAGVPATTYTATIEGAGLKCTTKGNSCNITGLKNGQSYLISVKASNAVAEVTSATSQPFVPAIRPTAPGMPAVTVNQTSATLTWAGSAYNGGLPIKEYTAQSTSGGKSCTTTGALSCTITDLAPGASYSFVVTAATDAGRSNASPGAAPVKIPALAKPGAPTVATLARAGDGAVAVSVTPPGTNGGSAITSYTVTSTPGGKRCTAILPATGCTISGLTNGTSYTFTALATSAVGSSPSSAPSAAIVAARPPTRPTAVVATVGTTGTLTVSWSAPDSNGGLPIGGYSVTGTQGGKGCTTTATSCVVTGLTPGKTYSFTVIATTPAGSSIASIGSTPVAAK